MKDYVGSCFEIQVDGKARSMRDIKGVALEAGQLLKQKQPGSKVTVHDLRDGSFVLIDSAKIVEMDSARKR
jgi:hypothetical protein